MKTCFAAVTLAVAAVATSATAEDGAGVSIVDLSKNLTATGGTGSLSAAGSLQPFGGIGVGCGINWQEGASFGGGLQAGSSSYGLGGGFTVTDTNLTVGIGIGVTTIYNASVNLDATETGDVTFTFKSTGAFSCESSVVDGMNAITCKSS